MGHRVQVRLRGLVLQRDASSAASLTLVALPSAAVTSFWFDSGTSVTGGLPAPVSTLFQVSA
ncbi:hypothetical protein ACIRA2_04885 [Streptomyces griseoviridis]